jgi:hypothetical protein
VVGFRRELADVLHMEDLLLLQLVREVSILADRKRPETVTQCAWGEARSTLDSAEGGDPDACDLPVSPLPSSARSIARSLGRPWREVLEIAHEPPGTWACVHKDAYALPLVLPADEADAPEEGRLFSVAEHSVDRPMVLSAQRFNLEMAPHPPHRASQDEL